MSDEVLGDRTAARARDDEEVHELLAALLRLQTRTGRGRIARFIELPARRIRACLHEAHGKTLVRTVFAERWPVHPEALGELRVKLARDAGLFAEIARVTGLAERTVRYHLEAAHGAGQVRNLFAGNWPSADELDAEKEEQEDDEDESDEDESDAEDGDDAEDEDGEDTSAIATFRVDPRGAWSRPRKLSVVFRQLEMDVPRRLRTPRFQEALQRLAQVGLELRLAHNEDDAPLTLDAATPGIHTRVCLRVAQAGGPRRRVTANHDRAAARRAPSSPPPPIIVLPEPPRPTPAPGPQHRDPGHEMALTRLQFLTAVPSMDRQHDAAWPDQYLAAAIAGLAVTEHEQRHLRMLAASFVRGHHSPSPVITRIIKTETPHDLDLLVEWFRYLNRSAAENAEEIAQWVHELRRGHPQPRQAPPQAHAPAPLFGPAVYAAAPPGRPPRATTVETPRSTPAAPKQGPEEAPANVRSLGALDDMFKG